FPHKRELKGVLKTIFNFLSELPRPLGVASSPHDEDFLLLRPDSVPALERVTEVLVSTGIQGSPDPTRIFRDAL
ncbi:MAG: hypothetical protein ACP5KW_00210, partial [Thermoproteota archaeon]